MTSLIDTYLSKEAKDAAEERSFDIAQKIIRMLKENISVAEIARECNVSTQRVEKLRVAL
jgi:hypothetical protein